MTLEHIGSILPRVLEAAAYRRLQEVYRTMPDEGPATPWAQLELELAESSWKLRLREAQEVQRVG